MWLSVAASFQKVFWVRDVKSWSETWRDEAAVEAIWAFTTSPSRTKVTSAPWSISVLMAAASRPVHRTTKEPEATRIVAWPARTLTELMGNGVQACLVLESALL